MRVFVTGASGLIGRRLCQTLCQRGDEIVALSRTPREAVPGVRWVLGDAATVGSLAAELDGCAAVVNLAGESIADRWTPKRRAAIVASRLEGTKALVAAIGTLAAKPAVLISASAIGYYGTDPESTFEETSGQGRGFLADLCYAWEKVAIGAEAFGVRVVRPRLGVVLATEGGALPRLLTPFRLGLGMTLGSGEQWISWIHIEDLIALLVWTLDNPSVKGAVNAVAPEPVRHRELMNGLGAMFGRRPWLKAPAPLIRVALGAMADEMLLSGQKVSAARARSLGFAYRYGTLNEALRALAEVMA